jgi:uncharacterized protein (TIGR03435 family)
MRGIGVALVVGMAVIAVAVMAAEQGPAQKPAFEVASIKPSLATNASSGQMVGRAPGGRLTATNVPLSFLIQNAYRVRPFQVIGGPSWMTTDWWDIEARAEEGTVPPQPGPPDPNVPDAMSLRLQSLLEDRFKLQIHRETRELPVFELSMAKAGLKAKLSNDQGPIRPPEPGTPPPQPGGPMPRGNISMRPGGLRAAATSMTRFAATLSQIVGRTVIDNTQLNALYDFELSWMPDVGQTVGPPLPPGVQLPPIDPSGPSLVTALQEQLGLKLESSKGPVEVLVVDSVSKPTEN